MEMEFESGDTARSSFRSSRAIPRLFSYLCLVRLCSPAIVVETSLELGKPKSPPEWMTKFLNSYTSIAEKFLQQWAAPERILHSLGSSQIGKHIAYYFYCLNGTASSISFDFLSQCCQRKERLRVSATQPFSCFSVRRLQRGVPAHVTA